MNGEMQQRYCGAGRPLLQDWEPPDVCRPEGMGSEVVRVTLKIAPSHFDQRAICYPDQPLDWT
jgi:hypothetical protein